MRGTNQKFRMCNSMSLSNLVVVGVARKNGRKSRRGPQPAGHVGIAASQGRGELQSVGGASEERRWADEERQRSAGGREESREKNCGIWKCGMADELCVFGSLRPLFS
ncbi:hypothetical protein LXL04_038191 [Taraxacum kok-saghyz]